MMIIKKIVPEPYASVYHNGCDYNVYGDGSVFVWKVYDDGYSNWIKYDSYEYYFDEIKEAGLKCLTGDAA